MINFMRFNQAPIYTYNLLTQYKAMITAIVFNKYLYYNVLGMEDIITIDDQVIEKQEFEIRENFIYRQLTKIR